MSNIVMINHLLNSLLNSLLDFILFQMIIPTAREGIDVKSGDNFIISKT